MVYAGFVGLVVLAWTIGCHGKADNKPAGKYPIELHQLFRERIAKGRVARTEGVWSSWGPWSPCSRTCGGGVSMQTRHCISRPVAELRKGRGRRRKHLETNEVTNQCVGLYKRYHLCNPQECPKGRDFRAEQCASFNARPFRGRVYFWEPFLKAGDECALNCRAVGMGFYATLNQTAKDGTPCFHPMTALLQMTPAGTRGVCVAGLCKSVSADGVIGAVSSLPRAGPQVTSRPGQAPQELCPACVTGCRTIAGLFTRPQLPPGYSLVTQVPQGACRLVVAQLKHTGNYVECKRGRSDRRRVLLASRRAAGDVTAGAGAAGAVSCLRHRLQDHRRPVHQAAAAARVLAGHAGAPGRVQARRRAVEAHGELCCVSADGVIGAVSSLSLAGPQVTSRPGQAPQELCPACVTGCRTIAGLFTRPQLPPGYSLVTQVPQGACRLVVAQLKHTGNYVALRASNGTYLLNGIPTSLGVNVDVISSGTRFIYRRQDTPLPETITAAGPLTHPVDIMMWSTQPNPGIKYEYMLPVEQVVDVAGPGGPPGGASPAGVPGGASSASLPRALPGGDGGPPRVEQKKLDKPLTTLSQGDDARPLRRRRRKFVWKIVGMTKCSKTCGGGIQYPQLICVRENNQATVLERRCANLEKPRNQTQRCNTQACPAYWAGTWSACSTTCGPGQQTRVLECMQEISPTLTMRVKDGACLDGRPPTTRRCDLAPCETRDNELEQELPTFSQWHTEPWTQCSVSCGPGQRTRQVLCPGRCRPEDRPPHLEPCHGPPCPLVTSQTPQVSPHTASPTAHSYPPHHHLHSHHKTHHQVPPTSSADNWWMVTDWTEQCSQGCGTGTQSRWVTCPTGECDPKAKPDTSRACSSEKQCGGRWFSGPWGSCSEACGETGKQTRDVLCIVHVRGQARIVSDMTCPAPDRPSSERLCEGACPPRWFTGEWGPCEGHCPSGVQRREVRCLEYDGRYATGCNQDMPQVKRGCQCEMGVSTKTDYTSRESSQAQDEPSPDHRGCSDQFSNCALVVQARLCQYPYYKTSCCLSCRRAQQDTKE